MVSVIIPSVHLVGNMPWLEKYQGIVIHDYQMKGKGWALQEGFRVSNGDRIVWIDADGEIDHTQIEELLKHDADIVVASKLHPLSKYNCPWYRRVLTWVSALTTKLLFNLPLRDTQTGLKVFKRKVLDYPWDIQGFGHDIEVLAKSYHRGYTILEVPVTINKTKCSTVSIKACVVTFFEILKVWWTIQ